MYLVFDEVYGEYECDSDSNYVLLAINEMLKFHNLTITRDTILDSLVIRL